MMSDRPIGVSILAVLHLIGGVVLLGAQVVLLGKLDEVSAIMDEVGIPPAALVFALLLLTGIVLASGIGMWLGARWGWWCAAFYYVYSVARSINALFSISDFADVLESESRGPGYYYFKFSVGAFIHALLLLYFFKSNVIEYFDMEDVHKGKAIGILVAATAAVYVMTLGISYLAG
jgi:hypothetical protein